jgi:hypothetical protein
MLPFVFFLFIHHALGRGKATGNRASGTLELWRRNAAGGLISCQKVENSDSFDVLAETSQDWVKQPSLWME